MFLWQHIPIHAPSELSPTVFTGASVDRIAARASFVATRKSLWMSAFWASGSVTLSGVDMTRTPMLFPSHIGCLGRRLSNKSKSKCLAWADCTPPLKSWALVAIVAPMANITKSIIFSSLVDLQLLTPVACSALKHKWDYPCLPVQPSGRQINF